MSALSAILEPDASGTLHLRLPLNLFKGKVRVVATSMEDEDTALKPDDELAALAALEQTRQRSGLQRRQLPPEELERRKQAALEALAELREASPFIDFSDLVRR
ncbi:MAG: hypothetical protein NTY98_04405 [Verrucomicrobia bacterium]|nr:hypothetical protein [Verrucomicrobiota bacterium]